MDPVTRRYRGYAIVFNDLGADIWSAAEYIDTVYGRDVEGNYYAAVRQIDEWMDAR